MNLKERLNQFNKTIGIDRTVEQQKEQKKEIREWIGFKDNELITGCFISREIFNSTIKHNYSLNKTDILTYLSLSCLVDRQGQAQVSQQEIADYIQQKDNSRVNKSLHKLEGALIEINRAVRPFQYSIKGYKQAFRKKSKGGFIIPNKLLKILIQANLKDIRLILYLCSLRHHIPSNRNKMAIKLNTLKKVVRAVSYKEVEDIFYKFKGVVFNTVEGIAEKAQRGYKGFKKLLAKFNTHNLNIGVKLQYYQHHHLKNEVVRVLKRMEIKPKLKNIIKVIDKIEDTAEFYWEEVKNLSLKPAIKSKYNSVNCVIGLIEHLEKRTC